MWPRRRAPSLPLALGVGVAIVVGACAPPVRTAGRTTGAILGGTTDTTHDAVLALIQRQGATSAYACSGTTIAQVGTSAFLLTAGHCVVAHDAMENIVTPVSVAAPSVMTVLPGPDWRVSLSAGHTYDVANISLAPGYDGTAANPNDVAVVRYLTYGQRVPVIPILEQADDQLAAGSTLTLVGFGRTDSDQQNSARRTVDRMIQSLTPKFLFYDQTDMMGQCNGDSGGPALVAGASGAHVGGVMSYGSSLPELVGPCHLDGASVRASSIAAFVHSVITAATPGDASTPPDGPGTADAAVSVDAAPASDTPGPQDTASPPMGCGKLSDPRPACAACLADRCCQQAAICAADPLCLGCGTTPMASCLAYPPAAILTTCLATCPGAPCGPPPSLDAGRTGVMDSPSGEDAGLTSGGAPPADAGGGGGDLGPSQTADANPVGTAPRDGDAAADAPATDGVSANASPSTPTLTPTGCGCSAGGAPGFSSHLGWLLALLGARRRRLVHRRSPPL